MQLLATRQSWLAPGPDWDDRVQTIAGFVVINVDRPFWVLRATVVLERRLDSLKIKSNEICSSSIRRSHKASQQRIPI